MRWGRKRITRYWISMGFSCMMAINANAQSITSGSGHTLIAGVGIQVLRDDALSLASESLSATSVAWSFSNSNEYRKKSILAGFENAGGNSAKASLHFNEFILQYTNAFSVLRNKSGRWNNFIGYTINVNPQYIKSGDQYSWATDNSLSFYNSLTYTWQKSRLLFDVSIPLAGFGSRPEANTVYEGSVNDMLYNSFSNMTFTSWHNLKAVNISLHYQQAITGRLSVLGRVSYSYKDMRINDRFLQQGYSVSAGLSYNIISR